MTQVHHTETAGSAYGAMNSPRTPERGDFVTGLSTAVQENPVAAALISMGVLWLFLGGSRTSLLASGSRSIFGGIGWGAEKAAGAARSAGSAVASAASAATDTLSNIGSGAGDAARGAASALGETVAQAASKAGDAVSSVYDAARPEAHPVEARPSRAVRSAYTPQQAGGEWGQSARDNLSQMFERQPLLLGAVGLAVGAGIAAALPKTAAESGWMGEASDAFKEQVQTFASDTAERTKQMAKEAVGEAASQVGSVGAAVRGLTDKLASVAETATDAAAARVRATGASRTDGLPKAR